MKGDRILNIIIAFLFSLPFGFLVFWPVLYLTLLLTSALIRKEAEAVMPTIEVFISLLATIIISFAFLVIFYRWLNRRAKFPKLK